MSPYCVLMHAEDIPSAAGIIRATCAAGASRALGERNKEAIMSPTTILEPLDAAQLERVTGAHHPPPPTAPPLQPGQQGGKITANVLAKKCVEGAAYAFGFGALGGVKGMALAGAAGCVGNAAAHVIRTKWPE